MAGKQPPRNQAQVTIISSKRDRDQRDKRDSGELATVRILRKKSYHLAFGRALSIWLDGDGDLCRAKMNAFLTAETP